MDASKLRRFLLLKDLEGTSIKPNHSKLAKVESERTPTKIFQYSDGTIEHTAKEDSEHGNELRKTSSISSVDSGFSVTPSSPSLPPHPFLSPAPYVGVNIILDPIPGDASHEERGFKLRDACASPTPPPLPSSSPPAFLEQTTSPLDSSDDETVLAKKGIANSSTRGNKNLDYNKSNRRQRRPASSSDYTTSGTDSSDSEENMDSLHIHTEGVSTGDIGVPTHISKLEEGEKTVRRSIRKGTVCDMRKLFKKSRKKEEDNNRTNSNDSDQSLKNESESDREQISGQTKEDNSDRSRVTVGKHRAAEYTPSGHIREKSNFQSGAKGYYMYTNDTVIPSECASQNEQIVQGRLSESATKQTTGKEGSDASDDDEKDPVVPVSEIVVVLNAGDLTKNESGTPKVRHSDLEIEIAPAKNNENEKSSKQNESKPESKRQCTSLTNPTISDDNLRPSKIAHSTNDEEQHSYKEKVLQELTLLQCFSTADDEISRLSQNEASSPEIPENSKPDTQKERSSKVYQSQATWNVANHQTSETHPDQEDNFGNESDRCRNKSKDRNPRNNNNHDHGNTTPDHDYLRREIAVVISDRDHGERNSDHCDASTDNSQSDTVHGPNATMERTQEAETFVARPGMETKHESQNLYVNTHSQINAGNREVDGRSKIYIKAKSEGADTFRSDVNHFTYVANSPANVYCTENKTSQLKVTMTSGDAYGRAETVTPVLINDRQVSHELDTGSSPGSSDLPEGGVNNVNKDHPQNLRADADLVDLETEGSSSSESTAYQSKIEAIGVQSSVTSDTERELYSDKCVNSLDGIKVIQVNGDLNPCENFSNNLLGSSDVWQEAGGTHEEQQRTELRPFDDASLGTSELIDNVKGVAHVALLCSGVLNHKTKEALEEGVDCGQPEALMPRVNDEHRVLTNVGYRETSTRYTDECSQADERDKKSPCVTSHGTTANDSLSHACLSPGKESVHVTSNLTSALTYSVQTSQVTDCSKTSTTAHEQRSRDIPEFYSLPGSFETSKIVTLKEIPAHRRRRMPERTSGYTSSESESSSYTGGRKVSTRTETMRSSKKDGKEMELKEGELESNIHVQHLAETMAKLTGDNTDDYLPEINQTVTKLPGGNLVITTLTHKVVEEEEENEEPSKVPEEGKNRYIVQDHTGQYYYVEDVTDEMQESAYYSSSDTKNTSSSSLQNSSYDGYGPSGEFQGIHSLRAVGKSNIGYDTAEEVLLGLYNSPGVMEIQEYDDRSFEERTWEKKGNMQTVPYGQMNSSNMSKQTTTYEYDDNNVKRPIPHNIGSSTVKTVKHMYEMESSAPWMTDGTTSRRADEVEGLTEQEDGHTETKRESMQTTETHADQTGMSSMCAAYMLQSSATTLPPVLPPPVLPPPVCIPPQYRVAKIDFTPSHVVTSTPALCESETQTEVQREEKEIVKTEKERPIYKTMALVKGPYESPKWQKTKDEDDHKRYKVIESRASEPLQEETVEYTENVKTMSTYKMEKSGFDENSNYTNDMLTTQFPEPQRFRTEKVFQINGTSPTPSPQKNFQTTINVKGSAPVHARNRDVDNHHYEYIHETRRDGCHGDDLEQPSDMRVIRGNILIKNTMDQDLEDYNDNINMFDRAFSMSKDNPLYQSDEDLYKRYEREKEQERLRNKRMEDRLNQDITFETVDRFTKSKEVKRQQERQRPKKNLSQLLLSRIACMDSKDIRQHIDVKHHNEDIYGDVNLIHADGTRGRSGGTSNFDSVDENVDLVMKDGKAFITIKVTAERISPIDLEFNVWRKSQAIVTRVIEIDFFANEQRRRLYENVMRRADGDEREYERLGPRGRHGYRPRETVLSSQETLDLFSEIMDAAEGEGDNEDITVRTSQKKTYIPRNSMDFLY